MMKVPFIGPFLESVNPDFKQYHAKWESGPLSCVSVFHKYDDLSPSAWTGLAPAFESRY